MLGAGGVAASPRPATPTLAAAHLAGGQRYAVHHPVSPLTTPGLTGYPVVSRWPAPTAPYVHLAGGRDVSAAPRWEPSNPRLGALTTLTMKAGVAATARSAGATDRNAGPIGSKSLGRQGA